MDEGQPQGQFQQPPVLAQAETKASKKPLAVVALCILVVLLIALAGFLYMSWQNTKKQLKTSQTQLATKSSELQEITAQSVAYRDALRKTDLASFADVIRAYNAKNHGQHLTTEGATSKNIYDTQLSKSITDFNDPKTGNTYGYVAVAKVQSPPPLEVGTIQYQWAGKCGAKTLEDTSDETLSAVATLLENGSMYCLQI